MRAVRTFPLSISRRLLRFQQGQGRAVRHLGYGWLVGLEYWAGVRDWPCRLPSAQAPPYQALVLVSRCRARTVVASETLVGGKLRIGQRGSRRKMCTQMDCAQLAIQRRQLGRGSVDRSGIGAA